MSDTSLGQTGSLYPINSDDVEPGDLRLDEKTATSSVVTPVPTAKLEAKIAAPRQAQNRAGTVEHLAARRTVTPVDATSTEVRERLSDLRSAITRVVTGFRWGGIALEDAAEQIISLLNVGSIYQWVPVLVPFILGIDRAGDFIPVWLHVIEQEDSPAPASHPVLFSIVLEEPQAARVAARHKKDARYRARWSGERRLTHH